MTSSIWLPQRQLLERTWGPDPADTAIRPRHADGSPGRVSLPGVPGGFRRGPVGPESHGGRPRTRGPTLRPGRAGTTIDLVRCVVTGATGYIGGRLAPRLAAEGHDVRCVVRDPAKMRDAPWAQQVEIVAGDVLDEESMRRACEGADVLYYLVHSLSEHGFAAVDRRAALISAQAAREAGVSRIVYLGGMHPEGVELSEHLASRAEVGETFLRSGVPTVDPAGGGDPRVGVGELRDAALPHRAPAGDAHAVVGAPPRPAHRHPRRPALPGRGGDAAARDQPDVRHRRPRRPDLPGDDGGLRRGRGAAATDDAAGPGADPAPVVALGQPGDPGAPLDGRAPHRLARPRGRRAPSTTSTEFVAPPEGGLTGFHRAVSLALQRISSGQVETRWSGANATYAPSDPLPSDPRVGGRHRLHRQPRAPRVRVGRARVARRHRHRRRARLVLVPAGLVGRAG